MAVFQDVDVAPRPTSVLTWKYVVRIEGMGIIGEGQSSVVHIGYGICANNSVRQMPATEASK